MEIVAPKTAKYCSEFMAEIPIGVVDKGICGCGMSSVALENDLPTVLIVPSVEIITNKVAQYPNHRREHSLYGIYGGVDLRDLEFYVHETPVPKILVTYDSFWRVLPYVDDTWRFIVDEFSEILDSYSYRSTAIDRMLRDVQKYTQVSYISATPIAPAYYPDCMIGIPSHVLKWQNTTQVTVERKQTDKPYAAACKVIEQYILKGDAGLNIKGYTSRHAIFFINSVSGIKSILNKTKLPAKDVKVVCSEKEANTAKLGRYKIQKSTDPERKFTFVTAKAFKGCDFYSTDAVCFVISNTYAKSTLLSISSDMIQISGRVRNPENPFRTTLYHFYNTDNSSMTREEFDLMVQEKIKTTEDWLYLYNNNPDQRQTIVNNFLKQTEDQQQDHYIQLNDNIPYGNYYRIKTDTRRWEVASAVYSTGLAVGQAYEAVDMFDAGEAAIVDSKKLEFTDDFMDRLAGIKFRERCIEYNKLLKSNDAVVEYMRFKYPDVCHAVETLGLKNLRAIRFSQTAIEEKVEAVQNTAELDAAVYAVFKNKTVWVGTEIKKSLAAIYTQQGLKQAAKIKDLERWFTMKRNKNMAYVLGRL